MQNGNVIVVGFVWRHDNRGYVLLLCRCIGVECPFCVKLQNLGIRSQSAVGNW